MKNTCVVSVRALDPANWGRREKDRLATVKRRVRAACCRTTLELLDPTAAVPCFTPRCFMRLPVDVSSTFDAMDYLCDQHGLSHLKFRGFGGTDAQPAEVRKDEQFADPEDSGE